MSSRLNANHPMTAMDRSRNAGAAILAGDVLASIKHSVGSALAWIAD
jgi:hypothetical protein